MIVQINDPVVGSDELIRMMTVTNRGGEFDTHNGEFSDAMARTVAQWWAITEVPAIVDLAEGRPVDHDELRDSIAGLGRSFNWPPSLEYMSTWLMNRNV